MVWSPPSPSVFLVVLLILYFVVGMNGMELNGIDSGRRNIFSWRTWPVWYMCHKTYIYYSSHT